MKFVEKKAQASHTATPSTSLNQAPQDSGLDHTKDFSLSEGLAELPDLYHCRKIQQRPLSACAGNALDCDRGRWRKVTHPGAL